MLIRDFLARNGEVWPDKIAYISPGGRFTWSETSARSHRLARALQDLGVVKGDIVASMTWDSHETVEVWMACAIVGAVRTGINPRYSPDELEHILVDSGARVLFISGGSCEQILAGLAERPQTLERVIGIGEHTRELDYEDVVDQANEPPSAVALEADDVMALSYTTGSTGMPKGVLWTHEGVVESCTRTWFQTGARVDDVFLHCLPAAGVPILDATFNVFNGSTVVIQSRFDPLDALEAIQREKVTTVLWVPTMLLDIVNHPKLGDFDLSSLRLVIYGSMPASPALVRKALDRIGCELQQWYGSTEGTGGWFAILTADDHRRAVSGEPAILESAGRPLLHSRLTLRDESGAEVDRGRVGEVCVRSRTVMRGYHNLPEETTEALRDDWLHTGDLGYLDEAGYLRIVDRKKFMIISGGYNIYPVVVENVLSEHPAVQEVCVFGLPDERWGETVCAAVVLAPDLSEDDRPAVHESLMELARAKLAQFERPKRIEFASSFPRGATGKLLKREVQSHFRNRT